MLQLKMLSHILPINVYIATLSALEIIQGNGQTGEIISIMADVEFFDRVECRLLMSSWIVVNALWFSRLNAVRCYCFRCLKICVRVLNSATTKAKEECKVIAIVDALVLDELHWCARNVFLVVVQAA